MPYCKSYLTDTSILRKSVLFKSAYSLMPEERKKKIDSFKFEEGKLLSLGAGLMFRKACIDAGLGEKEEILISSTGKPEFKNHRNLHFSISHSGKYAVCMISDCNIGCDIQIIKKAGVEIASRFFATEENSQLEKCKSLYEREVLFNKLWTLKESFVKTIGKGIDDDFNKFSIICNETISVKQNFNRNTYVFGNIDFDNNYCASYCIENPVSVDICNSCYLTEDCILRVIPEN